jgi:dTDP-glucose pyrophosphorylase
MGNGLDASLVRESGTIRDAMVALERGARRIAIAVDDDGCLVGVATDGDLRRALLAGATLDSPVAPCLSRRAITVGPRDDRAEVLELMSSRRVAAIPVVDDAGRPVGLHLLDEAIQPHDRPNWAVVMAGGRGTRLRPLTETVPKPMLRVAGRPILERIVLHIVGAGIDRIFLAVGYLGEVIEEHFGDGSGFGARIEYLREETPLLTGGPLGLLPQAPTEAVLVMNGDLVTQADLGGLLDAHAGSSNVATIGYRRYLHTVPFGTIERDADRIVGLEEKPTLARDVNAGIYALEPALIARVERGRAVALPELVGDAIERGESVGAFAIDDDWIDVGQREQLERAREGA